MLMFSSSLKFDHLFVWLLSNRQNVANTDLYRVYLRCRLPLDDQEVASVGNGEIATVVYTDTVYKNNLYNGIKGESHRARIPSRVNVRMQPVNGNTISGQKFILDTQSGT